jgi:hypothetical protein
MQTFRKLPKTSPNTPQTTYGINHAICTSPRILAAFRKNTEIHAARERSS